MNCIIANKDIGVRIVDGRITTCGRKDAQVFEHEKALHIIKTLPKIYKKFHMQIIYSSSDISCHAINDNQSLQKHQESNDGEAPVFPENIQIWIDKVKQFNGLSEEMIKRREILRISLSDIDRIISNIYHEIEFIQKPNACTGYKLFRKLKDALENRRVIKDEIQVIDHVSMITIKNFSTDELDDFLNKMSNKKFTYRQVHNNENTRTTDS